MTGLGLPSSFSAFVRLGARPTRAAICLPVRRPSSGRSATSVAATTGPTPHPTQSLGEAVELPIAGDVALDRLLDGLKALGQRRDDDRQALANKRVACEIGAAAFRLAGVDELPAPGGQRPQALVGAKGERQIRSRFGVGEILGDQHGVD